MCGPVSGHGPGVTQSTPDPHDTVPTQRSGGAPTGPDRTLYRNTTRPNIRDPLSGTRLTTGVWDGSGTLWVTPNCESDPHPSREPSGSSLAEAGRRWIRPESKGRTNARTYLGLLFSSSLLRRDKLNHLPGGQVPGVPGEDDLDHTFISSLTFRPPPTGTVGVVRSPRSRCRCGGRHR